MQLRALVLLAGFTVLLAPSLASAQTIQGQIIITEVPPSGPAVPPGYAPQPQVIVAPQAAPQIQYQQQMACPPGSTLSPDRWGRPACMAEVTRHHVIGGLLGGGIGLFAGGYLASVITTVVSGVIGAFSGTSSGSDLNSYFTWGYIPLLGPWVQLGYVPGYADGGLYAWLAIEGLMQSGGLVMLIFGAIGEDYTDFQPIAGLDVHLAPIMSASTQGLSATLTF